MGMEESKPHKPVVYTTESTKTTSPEIDNIPYETATFAFGWFWGPDGVFGNFNIISKLLVSFISHFGAS